MYFTSLKMTTKLDTEKKKGATLLSQSNYF